MSDTNPLDKFFGQFILNAGSLYLAYPKAGMKRIEQVTWYLKSRDPYEIVTVGYEDGTTQTIIHYFGDPITTHQNKVVKFVEPHVAPGDVLVIKAGDLQSVIFRENIPGDSLDAILQAIVKKIVKIQYIKQNEE